MALIYFSLGDDAEEAARSNLGDYYAFAGEYADDDRRTAPPRTRSRSAPPRRVRAGGLRRGDLLPGVGRPGQVDLLAAALG